MSLLIDHSARVISAFTFLFFFSLLTDMSRLLLHPNAEGWSAPTGAALPAAPSVNGSTTVVDGSSGSSNDVRRLQDEVNQLTKRNGGTSWCIVLSER